MKREIEEVELDTELKAALIVANSPEALVPARTTIAPEGGDVLEAAYIHDQKEAKLRRRDTSPFMA
jgi:hypothetical protein